MIKDDGKTIRHALTGKTYKYASAEEKQKAVETATIEAAMTKRHISNQIGRFISDEEALLRSRGADSVLLKQWSLFAPKPKVKADSHTLDQLIESLEPEEKLPSESNARLALFAKRIRDRDQKPEPEGPSAKAQKAIEKLSKLRERLLYDDTEDPARLVAVDHSIRQLQEGDESEGLAMLAKVEQREKEVVAQRREIIKEATLASEAKTRDLEAHESEIALPVDEPEPEPQFQLDAAEPETEAAA